MSQSGWNRSSSTVKSEPPKKPTALRGAVAGVLVVVILGIAAWLVFAPGEKKAPRGTKDSGTRQIKTVKPTAVPKPADETEQPVAKEAGPPKPYKDSYGNLWIAPHKPYRDPNALVVTYPDRVEPLEKVFKHTCNIRIGQLLSIEPGDDIEMQVFGENFRRDFMNSIADKIEILPDDDDYTKEVKKSVIECRQEIIDRAKKGEDPAKIMTEAWDELYRLGRFKSELKQQVLDLARNGECEAEDVDAMIAATDKMLEQKGLPPFKNKKFLERMMKVNASKAKSKKESEQ